VTAEHVAAPLLAVKQTGLWNDVTSMNWPEFRPFAALACLPAIVFLIAFGLAIDNMTAALAASSGALVVGFGAFQQGYRDPAEPMVLVCVGMKHLRRHRHAGAHVAAAGSDLRRLVEFWVGFDEHGRPRSRLARSAGQHRCW
jgi:hypothetical protein